MSKPVQNDKAVKSEEENSPSQPKRARTILRADQRISRRKKDQLQAIRGFRDEIREEFRQIRDAEKFRDE